MTIVMRTKVKDDLQKIAKAAKKANYENLRQAAFSLRKYVLSTLKKRKGPSAPGQPPHTRRGLIKKAMWVDVDRQNEVAYIGPRFSVMADAARAHEHGGIFRGESYPARPFMGPGLEEIAPRLAGHWSGTIG